MSTTQVDDPLQADIERVLRRVVDLTVVAPWSLATWAPRCLLRRLGALTRSGAPAVAVRTVVDLAQQAASPSEAAMDGFVTSRPPSTGPTDGAPAVAALPIEDYESLAASQVVTRLGALTPEGLRRVRAFETAHRGRRTIIGKIDQLVGLERVGPL